MNINLHNKELPLILLASATLLGLFAIVLVGQKNLPEGRQATPTFAPLPRDAQKAKEEFTGEFNLVLAEDDITPGDEVNLTVYLTAPEYNISGVDAVIEYEEDILEFISASPAELFETYPRARLDRPGRLIITGLQQNAALNYPSGVFATVTFKALESGDAEIEIDDDRSTIIEAESARNVLGKAEEVELRVEK